MDKLDPAAGKRRLLSALPATPPPSAACVPDRCPPALPDQRRAVADDGPTGWPGAPVRHSSAARLRRSVRWLLAVVVLVLQRVHAGSVLARNCWSDSTRAAVAFVLLAESIEHLHQRQLRCGTHGAQQLLEMLLQLARSCSRRTSRCCTPARHVRPRITLTQIQQSDRISRSGLHHPRCSISSSPFATHRPAHSASANITWNSGERLKSRSGCNSSTSFSNGTS